MAGARVWFSGTYDTVTDAEGHYEISLPPGEHDVEVWLPLDPLPTVEVGTVTVAAGGTETYDIRLPAENRSPQGSITWSRGDGRLVVGGLAADDSARPQDPRRGAQPHARASGCAPTAAGATTPCCRPMPPARRQPSTNWRFGRSVPRGDYGVSLIVIDDQRTRNPVPRPWRPVRVTR